jgi:hypothetical protein
MAAPPTNLQRTSDPTSRGTRFVPAPKQGVSPLVRQLGLQEIMQRDAAKIPEPDMDITGDRAVESALAGHVRKSWQRNKLAKVKIDIGLLSDLRARRGIYSAAQVATMQASNGGLNMVWAPLTEVKCRAASAWIREIVLPVGEQPWGVDPTPLPDLPISIKRAIVGKALEQAKQAMVQAGQQGGGVMAPQEFHDLTVALGEKLRDEAEQQFTKIAQKRAKRMETQIGDRLVQGGYYEAIDSFIEDFVTYPAAILKGPIYTRHRTLKWGAGFKPEVSNDPQQTWERVSPFDVYPAPASRSCDDGDFVERIRFRRDELFQLRGLPGYQDEQIDKALRDYSEGHLEGWLWTEAERQRLEQETLYMWLSPPGVIDTLNFWGNVPGWKLMSWGVKEDLEPTREYDANVLLCGHYVLYAALNADPLHKRPYHKACYDEVPGAFWGRSIPNLASTPQQMCNAIACALADNMAIASGPQVWVHADRFADGEQSMELFPWKIWQLKSDPTQGVNPGIGFFQPDDRAANLMATYEKWEIRADDATGIPRYTYGNERAGGSADTATGLSMLMNNAAKGLRRAISNVDTHVISPTINATFVNEMLYNPDQSIKGDCIVVPRGAAAILIRESMQQRRLQYLTIISNPLIAQIIGPQSVVNTLRQVAEAMELPVDEVVPTEDEMQQKAAAEQQAAQQQQQQQLQMQSQLAQIQSQSQIAIDTAHEQAKTTREQALKTQDTIGNVVKEAVAAAMATQKATGKPSKKIMYHYDTEGNLVGGEIGEGG